MIDTFYRDFEARFRGDLSVIKERLRVYESFLVPLAAQEGSHEALDLGCGRGEWLEILAEAGFEARGIDLDEGMLGVAREKGLSVENMGALAALRAVPDQTLTVVSAFHLIEHLPFDMVREIAAEARRALRPGGIMILETPNPENLVVGLVNFHLDATHIRPLPPILTSFVADYTGFARNAILRLQGATPQAETAANLTSLLTDVSLDYAVVAQVEGPQADDLDSAFALQLGMDLHSGVRRFDEASGARISDIHKALSSQGKTLTRLTGLTSNMAVHIEQARGLSDEVSALHREAGALRSELTALRVWSERGVLERMVFHRQSGRPSRALRRLMFHKSGKPRGVFRKWVLKSDGQPCRPFRQWMESPDYMGLPWPASRHQEPAPDPEENSLVFDPHRPRPMGLPGHVMTIEELVAKANQPTAGDT